MDGAKRGRGNFWHKPKTSDHARRRQYRRKKFRFGKLNPKGSKLKFRRRYSFIFSLLKWFGKNLKYFAIIIGLVGAFVFFRVMAKTDFFTVKNIHFEGIEQTGISGLEDIAAEYKGKNIYTVNLSQLEKDVAELSVYIKDVYAKKVLPSKIVVEVTERYPKYTYIDFDGVYLVDNDSYVVAVPLEGSISFNKYEWQAYYSKDADIRIVRERLIADMTEEEKKEIVIIEDGETVENGDERVKYDYAKIPIKDKLRVLNEVKAEITQVIRGHFAQLDEEINKSEYAGLQRLYVYDNSEIEEGERISGERLAYAIEVVEAFDRIDEYSISRMVWKSGFTLEVSTLEEKTFLFGINRGIDQQLESLEIIFIQLKREKKDFTVINLGADTIGVK